MNHFIKGRLKSFQYALNGCWLLITTEHSVIAQLGIFSVLILLGFYCNIPRQDWINQLLAMGMVLSAEGINTAVEKLSNFIHKEYHPQIGIIKDIAAGAVTFSFVILIVVLLLIYLPYFL